MAGQSVDTAMVLAAGLGKRMRPLTENQPKPMVPYNGKPLIDHVLDRLASAGISRAVVNLHYCADPLEAHLAARTSAPNIILSDERDQLLDTGGGVVRALDKLGSQPFLTHNSDSVWVDKPGVSNLQNLLSTWDPSKMDCLMLLTAPDQSVGYSGLGDFVFAGETEPLRRRGSVDTPALVFAGVTIIKPELFQNVPQGAFSMNVVWDRAIETGRLFGTRLDGTWMHIGTPDALAAAEAWSGDVER